MASRYSASGDQNLTAAAISCLSIVGATTVRSWTYDLMFANGGTPADLTSLWTLQRCTAEGTNTTVTPTPLDSDDPVAEMDGGENHTVEPTYTAGEELIEVYLNHRATFRWVAAPGGEIATPATATNGWGVFSLHASATTLFRATAHWME